MSNNQNQSSGKRWCFTWNNYPANAIDILSLLVADEKVTYLVAGREVGEQETKHIQGYLILKNRTRFGAVRRLLPGCHLEKAKGTPKQASDYCKKDGDVPLEYGVLPKPGKRNDISTVVELFKNYEGTVNEFCTQNPTYFPYAKYLDRVVRVEKRSTAPRLYVFVGQPGHGKSHNAAKVAETYASSAWVTITPSGFVLGYNGEKCVIIDDFRGTDVPYNVLLRMTDKYPYTCNVKGGQEQWNPDCIIFTNVEMPAAWYGNSNVENPEQLLRRFREHGTVVRCKRVGYPRYTYETARVNSDGTVVGLWRGHQVEDLVEQVPTPPTPVELPPAAQVSPFSSYEIPGEESD